MEKINLSIYNYPEDYIKIQKNLEIKNKINDLNQKTNSIEKYDEKKIKEISSDFASLFIKIMLDQLKNSLNPQEDILYGGFREDLWKNMLFDEYAKKMSKNGLSSLSEMIYKSIINNYKNKF